MAQAVQIVGALAILIAFVAAQAGLVDQRSRAYLITNLVGSVVLAAAAYLERQWGFFILETAWAAVSAWGLVRALSRKAPAVRRP
jgi:hypothetical protein